MSNEFTCLENLISLKSGIEAATGESYNDLTEAVQVLKDGYGPGGAPDFPYLDTTEITDYTDFFKQGIRKEVIGKVDTSNATNVTNMYYGCDFLEVAPPMNTSNVENFYGMFFGCSQLKQAPELDTSNGKNLYAMFANCKLLESVPTLDTRNAVDMTSLFSGCLNMAGVAILDTSNCTTLATAFSDCKNITEIYFNDTSKCEDFTATFLRCDKLHTIKKLNMKNGGYSSGTFQSSTALANIEFEEVKVVNDKLIFTYNPLTVESMMSLFNALIDNTGGTTYNIRLGTTNLKKLTAEQKQIALDKNFTLS